MLERPDECLLHELVGLVHARVEQAHVEIRTVRHEALASIRSTARARAVGTDDVRRREAALQATTDRAIAEADRLGRDAEARLLRV